MSSCQLLKRCTSPVFLLSFFSILLRWGWLEIDYAIMDQQPPQPDVFDSPSEVQYEVVTTNYGWHSDIMAQRNLSRRILTGEFFNATLEHPRYNSSANWGDLEANPDPSRRLVAILDVDTCLELNYPIYGGRDWWKNLEPGRAPAGRYNSVASDSCGYLARAATSPALAANPASRLLIMDCSGVSRFQLQKVCNGDKRVFQNKQVVVAYLSAHRGEVRQGIDVGLPPPAIKPLDLSSYEKYLVASCPKRRYLFSFQGRPMQQWVVGNGPRMLLRDKLAEFDVHDDMHVKLIDQKYYKGDIKVDDASKPDKSSVGDRFNYTGIVRDSVFVGAPRGDNLFSYRFSEILSAGAVPVVYADGYVFPFNDRVVNWTECAVQIHERDVGRTREILLAIPEDVRCRMQRCAIELWDKYFASRSGWVRGLVEATLSTNDTRSR